MTAKNDMRVVASVDSNVESPQLEQWHYYGVSHYYDRHYAPSQLPFVSLAGCRDLYLVYKAGRFHGIVSFNRPLTNDELEKYRLFEIGSL